MPNKVLFILKKREDVIDKEKNIKKVIQTGLFNSSNYLNDILNNMGIESHLEIAIDNNCIDRLVTKHRPTHVVIEALWVVPPKFIILCKLHPTVKWIVRLHSETPFIACEGIAMQWITKYLLFQNVYLGVNSVRMLREMKEIFKIKFENAKIIDEKIIYLPNYYPIDNIEMKSYNKEKDTINISCFGAIRPLKNQLMQAVAAIEFANKINKKLRFHINATRVEGNGLPVYHNLKYLFEELDVNKYELVEHPWYDKEEFHTICTDMDIGLQVSFSETFNIVCCDLLKQGIPIITSTDIVWSDSKYQANPTDSLDIVNKMLLTYEDLEENVKSNVKSLNEYLDKTKEAWYNYFG
jgi:hypothetical protein